MPTFSDENIAKLFGTEAAEDEDVDRFKQYFFFNNAYQSINSDLPIRILVGHKGVGKSALLKRAYLNCLDNDTVALWLQPGDYEHIPRISSDVSFIETIERIKIAVIDIIANKIYGTESFSKSPLTLAAHGIGYIDAISERLKRIGEQIQRAAKSKLYDDFLKNRKITVFIDDIDRGWSASRNDIMRISALLNAIRDMTNSDKGIRFRIGLRSDVYFLVRTSDESTDKLESNVVWVNWTQHDILSIMARRISTFFGEDIGQDRLKNMSQDLISKEIYSKVITPIFEGRGHWAARPIHNVLMSLTRKRPRDLVKLMHAAARRANTDKSEIIASYHLANIFESYSNERLQDIINEFKSEAPSIEQLLLNMKPTKIEKKTSQSFMFSTDELSKKVSKALNACSFSFSNGRHVSGRSVIQFLYKIDFITARKEIDGVIQRRYFDESRFLANDFTDFGFDWEIHPAYRWALQPQNVQNVFESLDV